jgi:hypothetical protein
VLSDNLDYLIIRHLSSVALIVSTLPVFVMSQQCMKQQIFYSLSGVSGCSVSCVGVVYSICCVI